MTGDCAVDDDFLDELFSIKWMPVLVNPPQGDEFLPHSWDKTCNTATPKHVRPQQDRWSCSSSYRLLDGDIRSSDFMSALGWNKAVPANVVAKQIVSLAKHYSRSADQLKLRQTLASTIPRLYQLISEALPAAIEDRVNAELLGEG